MVLGWLMFSIANLGPFTPGFPNHPNHPTKSNYPIHPYQPDTPSPSTKPHPLRPPNTTQPPFFTAAGLYQKEFYLLEIGIVQMNGLDIALITIIRILNHTRIRHGLKSDI